VVSTTVSALTASGAIKKSENSQSAGTNLFDLNIADLRLSRRFLVESIGAVITVISNIVVKGSIFQRKFGSP
jgi:hypothetical protein